MAAKLTLSLDPVIIERGKSIAKASGKSLSQMVSDYIVLLDKTTGDTVGGSVVPPSHKLESLVGMGAGSTRPSTIDDYHRHLQEKYRS